MCKKNKDIEGYYELYGYAMVFNEYMDIRQLKYISRHTTKNERKKIIEIIKTDISDEECMDYFKSLGKEFLYYKKRKRRRIKKKLIKFLCLDGMYSEKDRMLVNLVFSSDIDELKMVNWYVRRFTKNKYNINKRIRKNIATQTQILKDEFIENIKKCNYFINELSKSEYSSTTELKEIQDETNNFIEMIERIDPKIPTIALVGKTKAGKSTLFYGLTDEAHELIGGGGQRASKIVVAWEKNGIKYVDTPGLDAAGEKKKIDEKRAFDISSYADFIIVVLGHNTDGITDKIRECIEELYANNVPFMIVTNKKGVNIDNLKCRDAIDDDCENLKILPKVYEDDEVKKIQVCIGAVHYYKHRKRVKNGIEKFVKNEIDNNWENLRANIFRRKKNRIYVKLGEKIQKHIREADDKMFGVNKQKEYLQEQLDKYEKDIELLIEQHFEEKFFSLYSEEDLLNEFGYLSYKAYQKKVSELVNSILEDRRVIIEMSRIESKYELDYQMDNQENNIIKTCIATNMKNSTIKFIYGKDMKKILGYTTMITCIGSYFVPQLRIVSFATWGAGFLTNYFSKTSKKEKKQEIAKQRVDEIHKIINAAKEALLNEKHNEREKYQERKNVCMDKEISKLCEWKEINIEYLRQMKEVH